MEYPYRLLPRREKNELLMHAMYAMEEPQIHYAKWKKSEVKVYRFIWNIQRKEICRHGKQICGWLGLSGGEWGATTDVHEDPFWGDGNVLRLDGGDIVSQFCRFTEDHELHSWNKWILWLWKWSLKKALKN